MDAKLKLCRDCKWSLEFEKEWLLKCANPEVNKGDPWALAAKAPVSGTSCREEREGGRFTSVCGKRGAKWEPRD